MSIFSIYDDYDDFTGEVKMNGHWYASSEEADDAYLNECDRKYDEMKDDALCGQ